MLKSLIRTPLYIFVISAFSTQHASACSCAYAGEFAEYSKGQTIIKGTVISYGPKLSHGKNLYETMTVNVDELIQGAFVHSAIEFIGDPGHLCLAYIYSDNYPIGSEHLFTVLKEDKKQGLGGCGEVSVSIVNGKVEGTKYTDVNNDNRVGYSIEYNLFVESLTNPQTSKETIHLSTNQTLIKNKPWWKFWQSN